MSDIKFQDHTQTNFTFPVTIDYDTTLDPNGSVLSDLVTKCASDSDVSVTVNIKVDLLQSTAYRGVLTNWISS